MTSAQVNHAGNKVKPDSIYLSGYTALSEASNLEKKKQYKAAWNKYHQALRYYKTININFPEWNKTLVNRRLESTTAKIKEIEPLASKEHVTQQQKLTQYQKANTSENGIPSLQLPSKLGNNSQHVADLNAKAQQLQKALDVERSKYQTEKTKLEKQITTLNNQLRKATQGLSSENTQTKILNDQIAKLKQELKSSQTQSNFQQQKQIEALDHLTRERAMLATAPLKQDIERLTQDKARFEMELDSMVGVHKRLLESHQKLTKERDDLANTLNLERLALEKANAALLKAKNNGNKVVEGLREQIRVQAAQIQAQSELLAAKEKENMLMKLIES